MNQLITRNYKSPRAATQEVLMSVYRTLETRGHGPRQSMVDALTTGAAAGKLPSMPSPPMANG